jgi:hypothetical protein
MVSAIKKSWRSICCPSWVFMVAPTFCRTACPCSPLKHIKTFLVPQNFQVIDRLNNSSDLNLMENCWNHMNNLLKKKDTSWLLPELTVAIKELWTPELTINYLQKLSDSMHRRLKM